MPFLYLCPYSIQLLLWESEFPTNCINENPPKKQDMLLDPLASHLPTGLPNVYRHPLISVNWVDTRLTLEPHTWCNHPSSATAAAHQDLSQSIPKRLPPHWKSLGLISSQMAKLYQQILYPPTSIPNKKRSEDALGQFCTHCSWPQLQQLTYNLIHMSVTQGTQLWTNTIINAPVIWMWQIHNQAQNDINLLRWTSGTSSGTNGPKTVPCFNSSHQ